MSDSKKTNILLMALPGIAIAFVLSYAGYKLSKLHYLLDGFALAIIFGLLVSLLFKKTSLLKVGSAICRDLLIPIGLMLYGAQMNFNKYAGMNISIIINIVICIVSFFIVIMLLNKLFKIPTKTTLLTCGGSAVCGVSAIAVLSPAVDAKEEDTTTALVAILVVGVISVFLTWYVLYPLSKMSVESYKAFVATTLNQTGLVKMAAGFTGDKAIVSGAKVIKYVRTALIVPLMFVIILINSFSGGSKISKYQKKNTLQMGILIGALFFGMALLFSFTGLHQYAKPIKPYYKVIFGMALASIGMSGDLFRLNVKHVVLNTLSALIAWGVVITIYILLLNPIK